MLEEITAEALNLKTGREAGTDDKTKTCIKLGFLQM